MSFRITKLMAYIFGQNKEDKTTIREEGEELKGAAERKERRGRRAERDGMAGRWRGKRKKS